MFILLDNVNFQKNGLQNRNKIKTHEGYQWLTVPVYHSQNQKINEILINNKLNWKKSISSQLFKIMANQNILRNIYLILRKSLKKME